MRGYTAVPDPWPMPTLPQWAANIANNAGLFVVGMVIVVGIGVVVWMVLSDRAERRRPDGGLHAFRPFHAGRRAARQGASMVAPAELSDQDAPAWVAGYHVGRMEPVASRK